MVFLFNFMVFLFNFMFILFNSIIVANIFVLAFLSYLYFSYKVLKTETKDVILELANKSPFPPLIILHLTIDIALGNLRSNLILSIFKLFFYLWIVFLAYIALF